MNVALQIRGLKEFPRSVRDGWRAGVLQALNVAGARGQELVVRNILDAHAVASGVLVNAIAFEAVQSVDISRVEIKALPPADVYVDPVETGTRPHFPPPSALLPWVKQKLHVGSEKQALSIAFAIARAISKRGTRAVLMFARAFTTLSGELQGIFERSIGAELQRRGLGK